MDVDLTRQLTRAVAAGGGEGEDDGPAGEPGEADCLENAGGPWHLGRVDDAANVLLGDGIRQTAQVVVPDNPLAPLAQARSDPSSDRPVRSGDQRAHGVQLARDRGESSSSAVSHHPGDLGYARPDGRQPTASDEDRAAADPPRPRPAARARGAAPARPAPPSEPRLRARGLGQDDAARGVAQPPRTRSRSRGCRSTRRTTTRRASGPTSRRRCAAPASTCRPRSSPPLAAPGVAIGDAALPLLLNALGLAGREHVFCARRLPRHPGAGDPRGCRASCSPTCPRVVAPRDRDAGRPPVGSLAPAREAASWARSRADAAALQRRGGGGAAERHALARPRRRATLESLQARTEGWAAGLYLAGLSLRDAADRRRCSRFSATTGISSTTWATRSLSGPDGRDARVPAGHVDPRPLQRAAVRRRPRREGRSALLGGIERANLFLVPLDERRAWFRYHHLFREVLRRELRGHAPRRSIARAARPRRRVGRRTRRRLAAVTTCSRPAGRAAADLIARVLERVLQTRPQRDRRPWLDALPEALVERDPELCLARAWLARLRRARGRRALGGRGRGGGRRARRARGRRDGGVAVAMLRATLAYGAGDLAAAERSARGRCELEDGAGLALAGRRARHARHRAVLPGAAADGSRRCSSRRSALAQRRRQQHGRAARRGDARGDRSGLRRRRRRGPLGRRAPTRCASASRWRSTRWGRCATAVAGRLAAAAGDLEAGAGAAASAPSSSPGAAPRGRRRSTRCAPAPSRRPLGDAVERRRDLLRSARVALARVAEPGHLRPPLDDAERRLRGRAAADAGRARRRALGARDVGAAAARAASSRSRRSARALHLAQHREDPRARHLPQARRRTRARRRSRRARELRLL